MNHEEKSKSSDSAPQQQEPAPVSIPVPRDIMAERLSGPPSKAGDPVLSDELVIEHRLRLRAMTDSNVEAARASGESSKTIARTLDAYGPILKHPRRTPRNKRKPLPPPPDISETSTDD